jgi:hypothetical protein
MKCESTIRQQDLPRIRISNPLEKLPRALLAGESYAIRFSCL